MKGKIRLDPLKTVLLMRAYLEDVDLDSPLEEMTAKYDTTGVVTIAGDCATVQMVISTGKMDRVRFAEFERHLRELGIKKVFWERHLPDGEIKFIERKIA